MSSAADYLQFSQMLANDGQLNGKRLLSPKTVESMSSIFVPDTVPGRLKGRGFGLSVQVTSDAGAANTRTSKWKVRLGRFFRHALPGGSQGEDGRDSDDSDRQPELPRPERRF